MKSKKPQVSFWQSLCLYVAENIPIEQRKRSKLSQTIVCLHYLTDYLIFWTIIQLNYNPSIPFNFDWPFVVARVLCVLLFLIFRMPVFFLADKIVLMLQFALSIPSFPFLDILAGAAEITMAGMWALTKQQRMLHFDSRFQISGAFLKQAIFYVSITVQNMLPNGNNLYEAQFVMLGCVAVMTLVDFSQFYYNRLTKAMLLRLDVIIILLALATIYQDVLGIGFLQFVFASVFLFTVAGLLLFFASTKHSDLLRLNSQQLGSLSQETLMEVMIELKRIAQMKDTEAVQTYLLKMREEAEDAQLLEKIAESQEKDGASRQEVLNSFIFQTLKRGAKSSARLRNLVIYLYSPSPRLYCFLDLNDWQHLREFKRIIAEQLNDSTLRQAEAQKELQTVKGLIQRYTRVSGILLQQLMKERIWEGKVQQYGDQLIELLEQLQKISQQGNTKSAEVRDLINRFALDCLPPKYQTAIVRREEGDVGMREDFGQLVVGGEEDNYLQVLQANNCFTKLTYLRKQKYIGKPLARILPPSLLAQISSHLKKLVRQPQQNPQLRPGFVENALGFVVYCRWKVQATTHRSGRAWKISIKQEYCDGGLLIATSQGIVEGFSQLGRYFGLTSSEKGKKLQGQVMIEIAANSVYYLSKGENLFEQQHQFQALRGAILTVLDELLLQGQRFWVLQMKQNDMRQSLASPITKSNCIEPPELEFNFDWANNRITTQHIEQDIELSESLKQEQRQVVNYGQNITEMRYFRERIDYKSNFEQERDCPSLQPHIQKALSSLSINQFHQKWDRKKNSAPLWFKASVGIIVFLALLGLISAVFYLLIFNSATSAAGMSLLVSTKLQQKLQSVVLLAELTTLTLYNSSANASQAITAQINFTNSLSSQLYALDQNIFNSNSGQAILNLLNTLNLHINSYLLNSNYPYRNALTLITNQIVPSFNAFIATTLNSYSSTFSSPSSRTATLICLSVLCFALFVLLWIISFRQGMRRREVAEILKFIDNDDLQLIRQRTLRFKQTWLDNVDSKQPEQEEYGDAEKQNTSPPKHLLSTFRLRKRKAFHVIWLTIFVILLVLINRQTFAFNELSDNYVFFQNSLSTQITALQSIWAQLNQASPNVTLIQSFVSSAQDNEFNKNVMLKAMAGGGQLDQWFINSYGAFWQSEAFCKYISDSNCLNIIGGAMTEGANMAICYLNIQHDVYIGIINLNASAFKLYSQSTQPNAALLSLYYLPTITQISNRLITSQFTSMSSSFTLTTQYIFIGLVIHSLLVLVILRWAIKDRTTNNRIEELLMIMPFEKLKNFSAFHKYYLKYYATF